MLVSRAIGARDPVIGCHMVLEGSVTVVLTSVMGHCATHTTHEAYKEECECGSVDAAGKRTRNNVEVVGLLLVKQFCEAFHDVLCCVVRTQEGPPFAVLDEERHRRGIGFRIVGTP